MFIYTKYSKNLRNKSQVPQRNRIVRMACMSGKKCFAPTISLYITGHLAVS